MTNEYKGNYDADKCTMDYSKHIVKDPRFEQIKKAVNHELEKSDESQVKTVALEQQKVEIPESNSVNQGRVITGLLDRRRKSFVSCRPVDDKCVNQIGCVTVYSDQSTDYKYLFAEPKEIPEIRDVIIKGLRQNNLFAICFVEADIFVLGIEDKVKDDGTYLYDLCRRKGVMFNPNIKKSHIKTLLYEKFATEMSKDRKTISIEFCAGWNCDEKVYMTAESRPYKSFPVVKNFPVANKKLIEQELTKDLLHNYVRELLRIRYWQDRAIIFLYPMAAILASLLKKGNVNTKFSLNLIVNEGISVQEICNWLQVLNRDRLIPVPIGTNRNEFEKKFSDYKDETMILDLRGFECETNHRQIVKQGKRMKAHQLACHECGTEEIIDEFLLVILSDTYFPDKGSFNIFLGTETVGIAMSEGFERKVDAMNSVIYEFICFIEDDYDNVLKIIEKHGRREKQTSALTVVMEIADKFWRRLGYDMIKTLHLPEKIDFAKLQNIHNESIENIIEAFKNAVFEEAENYQFSNKGTHAPIGKVVFVKKNRYCFPTEIMDEIMKKHRLLYHKNRMMQELAKREIIETDGVGGYTMRLKEDSVQKEHYCIVKDFFDETGALKLWQIGKEE